MNTDAQLRTRHVDTSTAVVPGKQGRMHNPFFTKKAQGLRIYLLAAAGSVAGTTFYEKNLISKIYADKANRMNKMDKR